MYIRDLLRKMTLVVTVSVDGTTRCKKEGLGTSMDTQTHPGSRADYSHVPRTIVSPGLGAIYILKECQLFTKIENWVIGP